ncbi:MAG: putative Histidine kinase [Verrucomicrobiales bacterium]|nr:putative Histidine kinase [Verrucomicrobiales bacterium]
MKQSDQLPRFLFSAAATLLVVTLVFTYLVGWYVVRWTRSMSTERNVIQHLMRLSSTLADAETGQRGYLLTGKDQYLEPYRDAVRRLHAEMETVDGFGRDGELPAKDVATLNEHIISKMTELEQTIALYRTNAAAATVLVQSGRGKSEMDQIRHVTAMLIDREEIDYLHMMRLSSRGTFARTATFLLTGGINLAFLAWVYRRLGTESRDRRVAAQKLQNTIDSISDGLMIVDHKWNITYLSKQGARILHAQDSQLVNKNLWDALPQARERKSCPHFEEAMQKKEPRHFEEYYSSTDQWLEVHCYPSPEGLSVYFHDITERKLAEQVLAQSKEDLEKLVAERTAKLQELVGELEHFSYTITHDMRSPLRAMSGFAEMLEDLGATSTEEQRKHFLSRISAAARRMDLLITDALNYNRAVREELPQESVDIGALVRGMIDTYPEFQPSKARITIADNIPRVIGNEAGLTQCFSNLLGNAVKFVQPGNEPRITIRSEPKDGWVRIWVEDEGIGIPPTVMPKVFDMFTRGQTTHDGTGIGLALVRKVVSRMGGRVGVESEQGKGSRFWIELRSAGSTATAQRTLAAHSS